jgi:hypothetical protein
MSHEVLAIMDQATWYWLLGPDGQQWLERAMAADLRDAAQLTVLAGLRRTLSAGQAAAVYQQARLRQRAAARFERAAQLYFTTEGLEQASSAPVARHRAARLAALGPVADLACGCGGDLLALAARTPTLGIDRDPLRLAMAAENLRVCGLAAHATLREADLCQLTRDDLPGQLGGIFYDPARRRAGRRLHADAAYDPPVELARRWRPGVPLLGIKVAPGCDLAALPADLAGEVEFVSLDGALKEATLWSGEASRPGRRATLLDRAGHAVTLEDAAPPAPLVGAPQAWLFEPDPAVIRAGLVTTVAARLGARQLDAQIAYLTGDAAPASPFVRAWRILEWAPFSLKRLRRALRARGAGAVTVKKRGSPLDTDALARDLSGTADGPPLVVVLTRVAGQPAALICAGPS